MRRVTLKNLSGGDDFTTESSFFSTDKLGVAANKKYWQEINLFVPLFYTQNCMTNEKEKIERIKYPILGGTWLGELFKIEYMLKVTIEYEPLNIFC